MKQWFVFSGFPQRLPVSPDTHPLQKSEGICITFAACAVRVSLMVALAGITKGIVSWQSGSDGSCAPGGHWLILAGLAGCGRVSLLRRLQSLTQLCDQEREQHQQGSEINTKSNRRLRGTWCWVKKGHCFRSACLVLVCNSKDWLLWAGTTHVPAKSLLLFQPAPVLFSKVEQLRYVNFADISFFFKHYSFQCPRYRMALQKYRMTKAVVISFTTASPLLNALKGKEQLRLVFLIHVSSPAYQLDAQAEPSFVCSVRGRCWMHAQLDNRWDLHVKISEAPSTTFINVRPLFFFLFFLRDEQIFLYVRDKQGFFSC